MILKNIRALVIISFCFIPTICFATTTPVSDNSSATTSSAEPVLGAIEVSNAWAREGAGNKNSAVYLEIRNNSNTDYNLINVSSEAANRVELHQSFVDEKGISKMQKLDKLVIPAKTSALLKPNGMHIMLLNLKSLLKSGDKFDLTLYFDNNTKNTIEVEVGNKGN